MCPPCTLFKQTLKKIVPIFKFLFNFCWSYFLDQKALETGAEIIEYIEAHEALALLLMLTRKLNLKHVAPLFLYFSLVFGLEKSK